jgi:hypothetical protein
MTLFQIMDTHPFAAGLAIGVLLTFGLLVVCAGLLTLLLGAGNRATAVAPANGSSNEKAHAIPSIAVNAPGSNSTPSGDRQYSVAGLPR